MKTARIKYMNGEEVCPKCGGMVCYDATFQQKLPLGFGFAPGETSFRVDSILEKGFRGQCMECGQRVDAIKSRRHVTNRPRSINRKINNARTNR